MKDLFETIYGNFKKKNPGWAVKIIEQILIHLKSNGLKLNQAMEIIDELNGYTPNTISEIATRCQYNQKTIGSKHYKYFIQLCRNTAAEPKRIYRTANITLNLPK